MTSSKRIKREIYMGKTEEKRGYGNRKNTKVYEGKINSADRISQLPDETIERILSFLPPKDLFIASILSRTWQRISLISPTQHFNQGSFLIGLPVDDEVERGIRAKFLDFVDESLQSMCKQKESVQRFSLCMQDYYKKYDPRINEWIRLTADNNFQVLLIRFGTYHPLYSLPQTIFASNLLSVLSLDTCKLKDYSLNDTTRLDSLEHLSLKCVRLSEDTLNRLISVSPAITNFSLKLCKGVKFLMLLPLRRLKKVVVHEGCTVGGSDWIQRINVKAKSLHTFDFYGRSGKECEINLIHCENLEVLSLNATILPRLFSDRLFCKFPLLKSLFIFGRHMYKSVDIVSPRLELLNLHYAENMEDATIDTENLRSFKYAGYDFEPFLFSMKARCLRKIRLKFNCYSIDASWFLKLRELVRKLSHIEVLSLRYLRIPARAATFHLEELEEILISPVCHVKHLKLKFGKAVNSFNFKALVDGILWSCHPKTLTMQSDGEQSIFVKVLTKKLKHLKKGQRNCCESTRNKCWRHDLKDVEIEQFTGTSKKKPLTRRQMISFRFKW